MDEIFNELSVINGCNFAIVVDKPEMDEMFNELLVINGWYEFNEGCNPDT